MALSIDRYRRGSLFCPIFATHRERGKLINLLVSLESFSVPTKTSVSLLKAESTWGTSHFGCGDFVPEILLVWSTDAMVM